MNIQTHAYNTKRKMPRHKVMEMLEDIYSTADDSMRDQLAAAYKAYIPAATKKPKNVFDWVYMARGTEQTRPYLNFVWSDGEGNIVATDGHRLHLARMDLVRGFYDGQCKPVDYDGTFPDFWRVIPEDHPQTVDFNGCELVNIGKTIAYKHNGGTLDGGITVNKQYIDAANSMGASVFSYPSKDSMAFKACKAQWPDGRVAVVMGLRV